MHPLIQPLARALGFNPIAWLRNTRQMQREVLADLQRHAAASPPQPANDRSPRVVAVITPWQGTSVPWYTLALALLLARQGQRIHLVLDDFPFGDKPWRYRFVLRCLAQTLGKLAPSFQVTRLSTLAQASDADTGNDPLVQSLARMNTTWQLRGEMLETGRQAYITQCAQQIGRADRPIARLLAAQQPEVLLVPGGVFGTSGLWVAHARERGVRVCSFDAGGYGVAMFATNGVACHLQDIPEAFRRLKLGGSTAEHDFAHAAAVAEMAKRRQGVDAFSSQIAGSGGGDTRHDGAVLIALNSSWDAAALGLHMVYRDNTHWIVETVRYLLQHTAARVIVRQHPVERLPIAWTSDDYRALLQRHFRDEPRLHFIAAEDSINSYALLARVGAVVTYTSTIGIEAAAHGKPVITPSRAYYAGLGFVWQAPDLARYQQLLSEAANGQLQVNDQMRADAHLCYYLTQCCNWFFSPFNPSDFKDWSQQGLAALHEDEQVQVAVAALATGTPLAWLNHQRRFADARRSSLPAPAPEAAPLAAATP